MEEREYHRVKKKKQLKEHIKREKSIGKKKPTEIDEEKKKKLRKAKHIAEHKNSPKDTLEQQSAEGPARRFPKEDKEHEEKLLERRKSTRLKKNIIDTKKEKEKENEVINELKKKKKKEEELKEEEDREKREHAIPLSILEEEGVEQLTQFQLQNLKESCERVLEKIKKRELELLRKKAKKLRQQNECKICWDRPFDTVFLECGHLCACQHCAETLHSCPICSAAISRIVKVFKS